MKMMVSKYCVLSNNKEFMLEFKIPGGLFGQTAEDFWWYCGPGRSCK